MTYKCDSNKDIDTERHFTALSLGSARYTYLGWKMAFESAASENIEIRHN